MSCIQASFRFGMSQSLGPGRSSTGQRAHEDDRGDEQQQVNEPADVPDEPQQPEDEQNDDNRPQHVSGD
jgi:hypothetical protein